MITELKLGTVKTFGTLSGYVYLHIPQYLAKQFNILPSTAFSVIYKDGKMMLVQIKEETNAT